MVAPHASVSELRQPNARLALYGAIGVAIVTLVLFFSCSFRTFASQGEPREALTAKVMVESGDYIIPYRYDDVFATKPPFVHWLMLVASGGQAPDEWQARFPSVALAAVTAGLLFWCMAMHSSFEAGVFAVLALNSCLLWNRGACEARVDLPLAGLFFVAIIAFFGWRQTESQTRKSAWYITAMLALVAGLLTKGPVVGVLFAAIVGLFQLITSRSLIHSVVTVLSFIVPAVSLAGLWYLVAYQQRGEEFLKVILSENVQRMQGAMQQGNDPHQHSALYLFFTGLLGFVPLSIPLIWSWLIEPKRFFYFFRLSSVKTTLASAKKSPLLLLSLLAAAVPALFFCIPSSKRAEYLLPCYPFVIILLADWVSRRGERANLFARRLGLTAKWLTRGIVIALLLCCIALVVGRHAIGFLGKDADFYSNHSQVLLPAVGACFCFALTSAFLVRLLGVGKRPEISALMNFVLIIIGLGAIVLPPYSALHCASGFIDEMQPFLHGHSYVYTVGYQWDLQYYSGHRFKVLPEVGPVQPSSLVVADNKDIVRLQERFGVSEVVPIANSDDGVRKPGHRVVLAELFPKAKASKVPVLY
jgi:4-amino-4-deoxy-L-arabinose transferase-like glycosyltransferase